MQRLLTAGVVAAAIFIGGCSAANPPVASPSAVPSATAAASASVPSPTSAPASVSATAAATPIPTAAPTTAASPTAPPSFAAGELDPCTLLDPATDLALVGGSSGAPHLSSPTDWGPQCDYPTPNGVVQVVAFRPTVSDSVFESADSKIEVSALGDLAFYDTEWHRLRVRVGSDRFQVSCFCVLPSGTEQALLAQLAASAVARLVTP
jgi:hypothetical protein